jgi:hypothetical protein
MFVLYIILLLLYFTERKGTKNPASIDLLLRKLSKYFTFLMLLPDSIHIERTYKINAGVGGFDGFWEGESENRHLILEKKKLLRSIDEIKRPFASKESSDDGEQVSDVLSHCKDDANESKAKLV